jgi:uncharacterized protein
MSQENVKIVEKAYTDFKTGNIDALLANLAEDVQWELPEIKNVPFGGKRAGRQQVGQFFATVAENQEPLQFEPREFIAERDKVVALGNYKWRVKGTGKTFECAFAHVFTIRDGKVVRFQEFTDTGAAAGAYAE